MQKQRLIKRRCLSPALILLGIGLTLFGLASWPLPTHATPSASITVNTTADELNSDGDCSLREAIQAANTDAAVDACAAGSGADTITFDAATNGTPIVLTGPAAGDVNASGDLDILDGGDLTIQGNGRANTIIDGDEIDRVFHICPGGGCGNEVTISGVTIQNGRVMLTGGGGIRNQGTTTLDDCAVVDNTAVNGGGVANFATLLVRNGSTIGEPGAGNRAYVSNGGGIYNFAGTTTVSGSSVISNTAANNGGGIFNQATLDVENGSTISGNTADGEESADGGGGIYNYAGTTTVDGSTISANTAEFGGGIWNQATLQVRDGSTISSNAANGLQTYGAGGGGIYSRGGTATVDASTISENAARSGGGGGVALYVDSDDAVTMTLSGSTITDNTAARDGGGLFVRRPTGGSALVTLDGASVSGNTAEDDGGGMYVHGTSVVLTLDDGTLQSNEAQAGGGIYVTHYATVSVSNSIISDNETYWGGGGICALNYASVSIADSILSGNQATYAGGSGGGISSGSVLTVTNSTLSENEAPGEGGGIYSYDTASIVDTTISSNTAGSGGGVDNYGTAGLTNVTISGNRAEDGGGIYNWYEATLTNVTIANNVADSGDGGGIYNVEGPLAVDGSTLSGNTADGGGGGIFNDRWATARVMGSRILNNAATINGGGVYGDVNVTDATLVTGSCIVGNSDTSFFNNQPAQQTATGNWWGVATGPNTPGADTVGGNVTTSGHLTSPILGCAPDLQVTKANDTGGWATTGTPFHWTLTIDNSGLLDAVFGAGQEILVDDLPSGPAYGTPTVDDLVNVTGGANIGCTIAGNSVTCQAEGGGVTVGTAGSFTVAFSVTAAESGELSNPDGICRVDPDDNVAEDDEDNNCPTDTVEVATSTVYLPLAMRNASSP